MDFFEPILHFLKNPYEVLEGFLLKYESLTYLILALIIFCETGLVATPFLPGDSLLFAAGALAAKNPDVLNIWILIPLLMAAAILGDNTNYFFGKFLGKKVFERDYWFLKRKYLDQTTEFYEKHGGKTLIMARFVPIVRTFAPFVAGVGTMTYRRFIGYCILGCVLWVPTMTLLGRAFGELPFVKNNFEKVVLGIVFVSVLPMVFGILKSRFSKNA